jgi:hypothetical protein
MHSDDTASQRGNGSEQERASVDCSAGGLAEVRQETGTHLKKEGLGTRKDKHKFLYGRRTLSLPGDMGKDLEV